MTTHSAIHPFIRSSQAVGTAVLAAALLLGAHAHAAGVGEAVDAVESDAKAVAGEAKKTAHATKAVATDSWITAKVKAEILANSVSKAFKVGVTTTHGAVTLSGKLPNEDAVDLVKVITKNVKGVKSVDADALVVGN